MTEWLVRHFVKDYEHTEKVSVRTSYGIMASMVGIFCNVALFAAKGILGMLLCSISVTADAFNNLSDAGSSVITLIGVRMAGKPADKEHPFGHGRIEYISALIVSFLILEVGFTFLKDSIRNIRDPEMLKFQAPAAAILFVSIGVKLWLFVFNRKLGRRIQSKVMAATAADAVGDAVITASTVFSLLFFRATGINIDGWIGLGVSATVMWAGIGVARDTLRPLIGEAVPPEEYDKISRFVEGYPGILGSHDLIVHNYGPGRSMASIHAEVPNNADMELSHEVIDRIERDAKEMLGIFLVIHMDPVEIRDERVLRARRQTEETLRNIEPDAALHDFRMVMGKNRMNLIFDMVVPYRYNQEGENRLCEDLKEAMRKQDPCYQCMITIERGYVAERKDE